jgi:C_GCAxxG_C_C family probable redox protein
MIDRGALAKEYFLKGYNCSQAVLLAFSDLTGLDETVAMKMASSFGGGMGRLREVCGTVSASLMVLGILYGYDATVPTASEDKIEHYARVQEYANRFRAECGSIICREILDNHAKYLEAQSEAVIDDEQIVAMRSNSAIPTTRTEEYYKKRPCAEAAAKAARILDEYIQELKQ